MFWYHTIKSYALKEKKTILAKLLNQKYFKYT